MKKNIVYATDENYWMQLYVSIYSLLLNNQDLSFTIFILSENRNDEFFDRKEFLHTVHSDFEIEFVSVTEEDLPDVPLPKWFEKGIYYRLFVDSLLPDSCDRVLYLDCDTVIDASIEELFNINLENKVAAAVPERKNRSPMIGPPLYNRFYNTGVLYINLKNWHKNNIQERSLEFIEKTDDLSYPLQQILNTILHEDDLWRPMSPKYNMTVRWINGIERENAEVTPAIIHYAGPEKPWLYRLDPPMKSLWWEYLEETPYRDYTPPDKNMKNRLAKTFIAFSKKVALRMLRIYENRWKG